MSFCTVVTIFRLYSKACIDVAVTVHAEHTTVVVVVVVVVVVTILT